jgi:hypothetical protein
MIKYHREPQSLYGTERIDEIRIGAINFKGDAFKVHSYWK